MKRCLSPFPQPLSNSPFRHLFWIASAFCVLWILTADLNSYLPDKISRERADDIAKGIMAYTSKNGSVSNLDRPDWGIVLKEYLDNNVQQFVTPEGQIKDAR